MPLTRAHLTGFPGVLLRFHAANQRLSELVYGNFRRLCPQEVRERLRETQEVLALIEWLLPPGEERWEEWDWSFEECGN